jgi:oligopeptide transport system permease protein
MHLAPGNPFSDEKSLSPETLQSLNAYYQLDLSIWDQFLHYLVSLSKGNFGPSFSYGGTPVEQLIWQGFPISMVLGLQAFSIAIIVGYTSGIISAFKRGSLTDYFFFFSIVIGMSAPSFILAVFMQYFLSIEWHLLPIARWGGIAHTIMPSLALAALPAAFIAKLVRINTVETLEEDYMITAYSKGLSHRSILFKHIIRNACLPVLAYIGPLFAAIVTGSFVIEHLFHIPGIGRLFVYSVVNRDYPLIMGVTIFYSLLLLISVFVIDFIFHIVDPRIKKEGSV